MACDSDFQFSTAWSPSHIINKLLHGSFASSRIIVSLPVRGLRRQTCWNRSRNPDEVQPSRQSRVHRYQQVLPSGPGPVDTEFRLDLVPVPPQPRVCSRLAMTNPVNLNRKYNKDKRVFRILNS